MNRPSRGLRPEIAVRLRAAKTAGYEEHFLFPRHRGAILALAAFDLIFLIPAIWTFFEARALWQSSDDLFGLIAALFLTFWLMAWSLGPLLMTGLLAVLVFGRETVRARPGELVVDLGLPILRLQTSYRADQIHNLRMAPPQQNKANAWRGGHAVFDYGSSQGRFGIGLTAEGLAQIRLRIETETRAPLDAVAASTDQQWPRSTPAKPAEIHAHTATDPRRQGVTQKMAAPDAAANLAAPGLVSPSSLMLIAANVVPLLGAVFWQWDMGLIMLLYWAESAVIGFFNLCKIMVIGKWMGLGLALFFLAHFGGFMAVHFLFLYTLFLQNGQGAAANASLPEVATLFVGLWPALLALFVSHGFSFFYNFMGRGEYHQRSLKEQMSAPYSRIIFMHMVIIFGGALSMAVGATAPVIIGVVLLKTGFDLRAHIKTHDQVTGREAPEKAGIKPG